jgi:hypothetical protein
MDQDYYDKCWERTFAPEEDAEEKENAYWNKGDEDYQREKDDSI